MIPVVPFGIIFGVIGMEFGLSAYMTYGNVDHYFWWSFTNSFLTTIFRRCLFFSYITSVGAVNSRHLLYGAVFSEYLSDLKLTWKIIISYVLVDQAFAVQILILKKSKDKDKALSFIWSRVYLLDSLANINNFRNISRFSYT